MHKKCSKGQKCRLLTWEGIPAREVPREAHSCEREASGTDGIARETEEGDRKRAKDLAKNVPCIARKSKDGRGRPLWGVKVLCRRERWKLHPAQGGEHTRPSADDVYRVAHLKRV